jgi:hypothetical protein
MSLLKKIDPETIVEKTEYQELLQLVAGRLPHVIAHEAAIEVAKERKEIAELTYRALETELQRLGGFHGVIMDLPGETVDQRLQKRHERALRARSFLNSYDHFSQHRPGTPLESDFDPRLMKIIVNSVQAVKAFEAARPDIMRSIIIPSAGPAAAAPATRAGKKP